MVTRNMNVIEEKPKKNKIMIFLDDELSSLNPVFEFLAPLYPFTIENVFRICM